MHGAPGLTLVCALSLFADTKQVEKVNVLTLRWSLAETDSRLRLVAARALQVIVQGSNAPKESKPLHTDHTSNVRVLHDSVLVIIGRALYTCKYRHKT